MRKTDEEVFSQLDLDYAVERFLGRAEFDQFRARQSLEQRAALNHVKKHFTFNEFPLEVENRTIGEAVSRIVNEKIWVGANRKLNVFRSAAISIT